MFIETAIFTHFTGLNFDIAIVSYNPCHKCPTIWVCIRAFEFFEIPTWAWRRGESLAWQLLDSFRPIWEAEVRMEIVQHQGCLEYTYLDIYMYTDTNVCLCVYMYL